MKIIDAHAHIARNICGFTSRGELRGIGDGRAQYTTGEIIQMFPPELGDYGVTPEALLEVMDENDVEKAVLLQGNYLGFDNAYVYEAIHRYPARFTGAATYNPFCLKIGEIRKRLFDELGFKIVKFELSDGSGLMADRPPVYLNGRVMNECFAYARDRELTVVLDIGRPRSVCWQPDALADAIAKYPQVTFVICHLLAPQRQDKQLLRDKLKRLAMPNVYFDLSSLAHNQQPESYPYPTAIEHISAAKGIVGADRLMFGSDMPMNLTRDSYAHLRDYIIKSGVFSESELKDVFYNTAEKVYFN